jgi:hypothetical protein
MNKTTIQIPETTKEKLRDARLEHETNYGQTIERLLGDGGAQFATESDVRGIVSDMVIAEALE